LLHIFILKEEEGPTGNAKPVGLVPFYVLY